jgi:hypothetical protein
VGASRGELAAWSKRVSGTRAKRRWSEARGVATHEQKRTGVAVCGCSTDALDVSGSNEQWRAGRIRWSMSVQVTQELKRADARAPEEWW